ncbi:MAG TPA: hypothetical protein VGP93_02480 [Polyangiaceae bacterium]|nr:hypothetical protein [Polyangiaceae bacterium]
MHLVPRLAGHTGFLLLLLTLYGACRRPPPQAPPPSPPPATVAAAPTPAPAPPPPSCEGPNDDCKADATTRIQVADSGVAYSPPPGWKYLKAADYSRAEHAEGMASVGVTLANSESDDDVLAAVELLSKQLAIEHVSFDRLKKRLKKPQETLDSENGAIELWEINAGTQGGKSPEVKSRKGTALLALARVATERTMIALGFVVEPDDQGQAGLIMKSVQSLSVSK